MNKESGYDTAGLSDKVGIKVLAGVVVSSEAQLVEDSLLNSIWLLAEFRW